MGVVCVYVFVASITACCRPPHLHFSQSDQVILFTKLTDGNMLLSFFCFLSRIFKEEAIQLAS